MGRQTSPLLERMEDFADRVVSLAEALERQRRSSRIVGQIAVCGTSAGANVWEADEAVSPADFASRIGTSLKELSETRFWIRLIARRGWIRRELLTPFEAECVELKRILGAMHVRTYRNLGRAKRGR